MGHKAVCICFARTKKNVGSQAVLKNAFLGEIIVMQRINYSNANGCQHSSRSAPDVFWHDKRKELYLVQSRGAEMTMVLFISRRCVPVIRDGYHISSLREVAI
jgi:hypothetical protein